MRLSSCPKALCPFFTRNLAWDSPVCTWRPPSWKLIFFIPISVDEKGCSFCFRILANHLASFFFLHPVRRFVRTTIFIQYIPFFIHPVTECQHLLAFILTRISYFGREELTYIPYSSFNGQSLVACKFKHGGVGEIPYISPLSGRPRDSQWDPCWWCDMMIW